MNVKHLIILFFIYPLKHTFAQLPIGFDTLSVIENNKILYSAISGGINSSVCAGKNGFITTMKIPSMEIIKEHAELSVDTYFCAVRP